MTMLQKHRSNAFLESTSDLVSTHVTIDGVNYLMALPLSFLHLR